MDYLKQELILASASPRRKELLEQVGIKFSIIPSNVDESKLELNGDPHEKTIASALIKAKDVAGRLEKGLILGADTIVVLDGKIYGKPVNIQHSYEMLKSLSGKCHQVITGVALVDASTGIYLTGHEKTDVYFSFIDDDEIMAYINSGESVGKAGAYAIQGKGALFVEKIDGCYSNVVGLPISLLKKMLKNICKKEEF
ncbi:MAG: septum formation inhibitor Maf [Clostridiaceae bacterium]|nr:septum formation inhibitor Maf [Clostridiaceae bacterium]